MTKICAAYHKTCVHDLRNALAIIAGQAELIEKDALARRPFIPVRTQRIAESIRTCLAIMRELQDKADESNSTISPGIFDLNAVVRRVVSMIQDDMSGIVPELMLCLDPIPVCGDSFAMSRVIQNLLMNARNAALKGSEDPHIHISTGRRASVARLDIFDNGCGMTPEETLALWSNEPRNGDHGYGFRVVREAISKMGGYINVFSAEDMGALVLINIPIAPVSAVPMEEEI